jgi:hypothetical protein
MIKLLDLYYYFSKREIEELRIRNAIAMARG